ncbi:LicD family protein [Lachnospiraceae bacterium MD1]|jgi:lipopolysaccharide cholinephosphotransferase|uniref:LicD family protein n=1 Tax=Variimorphobacter saccharofermentans TaxID=2755051 RepID=A0A839K2L1_9FIRM|nr:LicD family protein [Variimorphobacter saccharofermentans]MBB2183432.1 LicD family protein [Variimorphobacter saccharofermentans]
MCQYKICQYDIKEVQDKLFTILIEVDRICRKHHIRYSLEGGTLLGAIKYKGFVPWDDDIDIVMERKEYEKFLKICRSELKEDFFLQNNRTVRDFPLSYSKIHRKGTLYVQDNTEHLKIHHGLFIDIFPVDHIFLPVLRLQIALIGSLTGARGMKLNRLYKKKEEITKNRLKLWIYQILALLPLRWINVSIDLICNILNPFPCKYYYELCNPNRKFRPLNRKVYQELIEMEFMGLRFLVSKHYRAFLKSRFGDIRKLPPEEERRPSHNIIRCKL